MKIDLIKKFTSRKFLAGLLSFAGALLTVFNVDKLTTEQIMLILGGMASLVAYIFAEAHVDGKRVKDELIIETEIDAGKDVNGNGA